MEDHLARNFADVTGNVLAFEEEEPFGVEKVAEWFHKRFCVFTHGPYAKVYSMNDFRYLRKMAWGTRFTDTCWLWEGGKNSGYGVIHTELGPTRIHRLSYEMFNGPIVCGVIRHTCDVRNCWNPDHLLDGTLQDNVQDMIDRNRKAKGAQANYPKGYKNHNSKFTPEQIAELRSKPKPYPRGWIMQMARKYEVKKETISKILSGKSYVE